jgi:hypothetical protein
MIGGIKMHELYEKMRRDKGMKVFEGAPPPFQPRPLTSEDDRWCMRCGAEGDPATDGLYDIGVRPMTNGEDGPHLLCKRCFAYEHAMPLDEAPSAERFEVRMALNSFVRDLEQRWEDLCQETRNDGSHTAEDTAYYYLLVDLKSSWQEVLEDENLPHLGDSDWVGAFLVLGRICSMACEWAEESRRQRGSRD